jgi:hypothetical protein
VLAAYALARDAASGVGGVELLSDEGPGAILPPPTMRAPGLTQTGVLPRGIGRTIPPSASGALHGGTADRDVPAVL